MCVLRSNHGGPRIALLCRMSRTEHNPPMSWQEWRRRRAWDLHQQGWTQQQILENYPGLTADDLSACLHYASDAVKSERVYPIPT